MPGHSHLNSELKRFTNALRLIHRQKEPATKRGALDRELGYVASMRDARPTYAISDNPEKHRFEADLGDGSFGIAEYKLFPGKIVFTHTEVPRAHEGQGVGSALIRYALSFARERGLEVIPLCPFFAAYIQRRAEEQDLLDPSWRKNLGLS